MKLLHGDCIQVMRTFADNSIDAVVTDPPYELGFMGKSWDSTGIAFNVEVWAECLRILKPGGHLLAFSGSRTYHRMAVAIEDAGLEIRDQIMWIYGSGFPKSYNLKDEWQGWGTALKPAHEPIVVARKPLIGTVAANVLTYGTGGLNIDGARVEGKLEGDPNRFAKTDGGWAIAELHEQPVVRSEGRWPANVIHDGSDEVVELFPSNVKGGTWNRTQGARNFNNDGEETNYVSAGSDASVGTAARFFYCAKTSKRDRNEGLDIDEFPLKHYTLENKMGGEGDTMLTGSGNPRDSRKQNYHPTVKPTDLMRYLCRLVTPPNGVVLDPFTGSGSTGKAAIYEGFKFIGIEMTEEYLPIAKARIEFAINDEDEKLL